VSGSREVGSVRYDDTRKRDAVAIPPGVWFPGEPVVETAIFSDRFDMTISLLQLERDSLTASVDAEPEEETGFTAF
jgi:hypothetical protein